jgi:adenylate cyclase
LSAELIVRLREEEQRFLLNPDVPYGIGRGSQNAICVPSDTVSRNHALIRRNESGAFCIIDLGSRNGTVLNDRLIGTQAELRDGDVISIGEVTLLFAQKIASANSTGRADAHEDSTVTTLAVAQLTVLVVDIRGYTSLARRIGDARIAEVIRTYNQTIGEILDHSRTWTAKYIGDAVMAVWRHGKNEPTARTVINAFDVYAKIHSVAAGLQRTFDLSDEISVGGGINTGYASVGNIGSGSNSDYTALGDAVNLAFRLESSTRALHCDLAFGPEVHAVLRSSLDMEGLVTRHLVCLKGYSDESDVYSMSAIDVHRMLKSLP